MSEILKYCVATDNIDFSPFRHFKDGSEFSYLLITTLPFLSSDPEVRPIMESMTFESDGKTATFRIADDIRWLDGSPLTTREAALSIAKGLTYRNLGARVAVLGFDGKSRDDWASQEYTGIRYLDDRTFQLVFESTIENLPGVLHEALSVDSRPNRLWPARLSKLKGDSYGEDFDVISRYSIQKGLSGQYFILAENHQIEIIPTKNCKEATFTSASNIESYSNLNDYTVQCSNGSNVLYLAINSKVHPQALETRASIARFFRQALQHPELSFDGTVFLDSHLLPGEPGFADVSWNSVGTDEFLPKCLTVSVVNDSLERNLTGLRLQTYAKKNGIELVWKHVSQLDSPPDVFLGIGRHKPERPLWLQNIPTDADSFLAKQFGFHDSSPKTLNALREIQQQSAATPPVSSGLIEAFERAAFEEQSIVPLQRIPLRELSHKSSPLELRCTESDELVFRKRN